MSPTLTDTRIVEEAMMPTELNIKIRLDDDGSLWATVDEFPGVFASGDNLDELRESLEEAISLVAEAEIHLSPLHPEPQPVATTAVVEPVLA